MMNLLAASPLLLALWGCRPVRPLTALDRESLSLERCLPLRGLMALVVLIHHLAQNTDSGALLRVYLNVGALPVSVFFFLSGYGLMRGAMTRSAYGRGFILRHVPPLAALLLAVLGLFSLLYAAMSRPLGLSALFGRILSGDPILVILWYVMVLILFYIAFGVFARLFPGRPGKLLAAMACFCLSYQGVCLCRTVGQWWYNSCQLLPLGMAWALYEERIDALLKKRWLPITLFCVLGFACVYQRFDAIYALHPGFGMRFAILAVENVLFTCGVVLMLKKLRIGNVLLRFLGGISLEFYVLQGLMLLLFRSGLIRIADDLIYAAAVIASTTALAALIHPLYAAAVRRYRQSIEK